MTWIKSFRFKTCKYKGMWHSLAGGLEDAISWSIQMEMNYTHPSKWYSFVGQLIATKRS